MDAHVNARLRAQHGWCTVAQLRAEGLTQGTIQGLVRRGRLERGGWALLRLPGAPRTARGEMMAAQLRAGRGARVVGPRALWLLDIRGFGPEDPFGILVPNTRNLPRNVTFRRWLDPSWWDGAVVADGITVPRPGRLAVEMARWHDGVALRSTLDACRWAGRPSNPVLLTTLAELPVDYRPARTVRALVAAGHLDQDSERERAVARILGDEFGPVETQVWVSSRRRADILLREFGILVEYQGQDHRTALGRQRDSIRDDEMEAIGLTVVPLYDEDLAHPDALRARIRRVIEYRTRRHGDRYRP